MNQQTGEWRGQRRQTSSSVVCVCDRQVNGVDNQDRPAAASCDDCQQKLHYKQHQMATTDS